MSERSQRPRSQHQKLKNRYLPLLPLPRTRVPKLRIDGTHNPTYIPSCLLPVNHSEIENRKDAPAATTNPSFANFLLFIFNPSNDETVLRARLNHDCHSYAALRNGVQFITEFCNDYRCMFFLPLAIANSHVTIASIIRDKMLPVSPTLKQLEW